jgi:hypothetical protein
MNGRTHMTKHCNFAFRRLTIGLALTVAASTPALATPPNLELIARALDGALPPIIGDDNSKLVEALQAPVLGTPISRAFKLEVAAQGAFKRAGTPTYDPGCDSKTAQPGSADEGECAAWVGDPGGTGAYTRLAFSKNLGKGNIGFRSRGPVATVSLTSLVPLDLDDAKAFSMALAFVTQSFGLPAGEVPIPPKNATNLNPFVSGESIGFSARYNPVLYRKIVTVPRGIKLKTPIVVDARTGMTLPFIPAPGFASIVIGQTGNVDTPIDVIDAQIQDWQDLRVNPNLDPKSAKSRKALMEEMTDDLMNEGGGTIGRISAQLVYGSDWRGTYGYLVPAVRIMVAPVAGPKTAEELTALYKSGTPTAGFIHDYPLVAPVEPPADPKRTTP